MNNKIYCKSGMFGEFGAHTASPTTFKIVRGASNGVVCRLTAGPATDEENENVIDETICVRDLNAPTSGAYMYE